MCEYDISKYDYEIIDSNENMDILNCLSNNNINLSNYLHFISKLSDKTIYDKNLLTYKHR